MARLFDSQGTLLGGLGSVDRAAVILPLHPVTDGKAQCCYGDAGFVYRVRPLDLQMARYRPRIRACGCALPYSEMRYHCRDCGGEYCAAHADPAAHDCVLIIRSD